MADGLPPCPGCQRRIVHRVACGHGHERVCIVCASRCTHCTGDAVGFVLKMADALETLQRRCQDRES